MEYVVSKNHGIHQERSHGAAVIEKTPVFEDSGQLECAMLSANPEMGIVSFHRLVADEEKILSVYWQADGFCEPPNLREMHTEFQQITDTIELKSDDS